jgi:hypothetical protein
MYMLSFFLYLYINHVCERGVGGRNLTWNKLSVNILNEVMNEGQC